MRSGEIKVDGLTTFQHAQDTADNKLKYSSVRGSFYERSVVNLVVQNNSKEKRREQFTDYDLIDIQRFEHGKLLIRQTTIQ